MCSTIQPIEGDNYFKQLGIQPSFNIDINILKRNFLKLQAKVHPDKFVQCSPVCYETTFKFNQALLTFPVSLEAYLVK